MTTIINNRYAVIKAYIYSLLGIEPAEDIEDMDEFAAKYLMTLILRMIWAASPEMLDDLAAEDPGVAAAIQCWLGGGTIEEGHVLLWP